MLKKKISRRNLVIAGLSIPLGGLLIPFFGGRLKSSRAKNLPTHIRLPSGQHHQGAPLEILKVESTENSITFHLRNYSENHIQFTTGGQHFEIDSRTDAVFMVAADGPVPFQSYIVKVESPGLQDVSQPVFVYRPNASVQWIIRKAGDYMVQIAPDGSGLRWLHDNTVVALAAPLIHYGGIVPEMSLREQDPRLVFHSDMASLSVTVLEDEVTIAIDSAHPCEGPVLRSLAALEQGMFAGIEYLGKGESSSSTMDIRTPEHVRFAPEPLKVTMPLMACRTNQVTAAMTWNDMTLQPTFAVPNFVDGCPVQRMSLRGKTITATLRVQPNSLEDMIDWMVKKHGLPPLPVAPRNAQQQLALCLQAINGPLRGRGGWGHCAEPSWERKFYASFASTYFRLTGVVPKVPSLVPEGTHLRNDTIYFVSGRVQQWQKVRWEEIAELLKQQQTDGSFRYSGRYLQKHFSNTASGYCAVPAAKLLDYAWLTGDDKALAAGLKTLEFMIRFNTPRGAQTWEVPLHTPDILASAYLVRAYMLGYTLTNNKNYLEIARKWALSGIPFVYLWGDRPIMRYGTVPVLGASNWIAPNWIGKPVQWCGLVYADALLLLAPHDTSLNWHHIARGILIAAEQMQYRGGPAVGCLPDSFDLPSQRPGGPSINPCTLVSVHMGLKGELAGLAVASDAGHRVVSPYPVTLRDGKIHITAPKGSAYQVLIDGKRVVNIVSKGQDILDAEAI